MNTFKSIIKIKKQKSKSGCTRVPVKGEGSGRGSKKKI